MGAGQSASIEQPFAIPPSITSDIAKLSAVAERVLSSPDIYDIENLTKPGVCGEYAVFLKQGLEQTLMKFTADVSGAGILPVVYANPAVDKKRFTDAARKEVCTQMATAGIRVITTIVACLASIQIGSNSVVLRGGRRTRKQRGGQRGGETDEERAKREEREEEELKALVNDEFDVESDPAALASAIRDLGDLKTPTVISGALVENKIIDSASIPAIYNSPISILKTGTTGGPYAMYDFKLQITQVTAQNSSAQISVKSKSTQVQQFEEASHLSVVFLHPIPYPANQNRNTCIPVRIKRPSNKQLIAAGVLFKGYFKSFNPETRKIPFIQLIYLLFASGADPTYFINNPSVFESRSNTLDAGKFYDRAVKDAYNGINLILTRTDPFLREMMSSRYGEQRSMYPFDLDRAPVEREFIPPAPRILSKKADTEFIIPTTELSALKKFFTSTTTNDLRKHSSPAKVRAETLAGRLDPTTRTVITGICNDVYWTSTYEKTVKDATGKDNKTQVPQTAGTIYPWLTLQNVSTLKWGDESHIAFDPLWKSEFIDPMMKLYNEEIHSQATALKLTAPMFLSSGGKPLMLTSYKFFAEKEGFKQLEGFFQCPPSRTPPHVAYREVQDGIARLQARYAAHVKAIWELLNELILVIEDPITKTQAVRLHPKVVDTAVGSKKYVDIKAQDAIRLIGAFYVDIERIYLETILSLHVVSS